MIFERRINYYETDSMRVVRMEKQSIVLLIQKLDQFN